MMTVLRPATFADIVQILGVIGGIVAFIFAVLQWIQQQDKERQARQSESVRIAETRRVEASKPFLELQLKRYTEATQVVAVLATADDPVETTRALRRFLELYWGELALVENREVEGSMVKIKEALDRKAPREEIELLSLGLARACRLSLDRSWGVRIWSAPDEVAGRNAQGGPTDHHSGVELRNGG